MSHGCEKRVPSEMLVLTFYLNYIGYYALQSLSMRYLAAVTVVVTVGHWMKTVFKSFPNKCITWPIQPWRGPAHEHKDKTQWQLL